MARDTWSTYNFNECLLQRIPSGQPDNHRFEPLFLPRENGAQTLRNPTDGSRVGTIGEAGQTFLERVLSLENSPPTDLPLGYLGRPQIHGRLE